MKKILKLRILLGFFCLLCFSSSYAQYRSVKPYNLGIGLRGGFLYGLSIKGFLNSHSVVEGIIGTRWQGYSITALYEYQQETKAGENLDWFYGFGAHVGSYAEKYFLKNNGGNAQSNKAVYAMGVDAIVGLEYKIIKVPVTFGLDFKPFIDLVNNNQNFLDAALTIRYVIK